MTNYDAILKMTPKQMETFLDQVYLTGMNNGLYMARLDDDEAVDFDPECYTMDWLLSEAEDATSKVFTDDGDTYLPNALTKAILCNAGIPADIAEEAEGESGNHGFSIKIGSSIKIRESEELDLDDLSLAELRALLDELQEKLEDLMAEEPDDEDSDEHEEWEDAVDELEDQISQVEDAIDEMDD